MSYSFSHSLRTESGRISVPSWKTCMGLQFSFVPTSTHGWTTHSGPRPPHGRGFTITLGRTMPDGTLLDEWSARHRNVYLTTHITHKRQTSMPPAGFKPAIPARERPQTHALDARPLGIGRFTVNQFRNLNYVTLISPLHHDIYLAYVGFILARKWKIRSWGIHQLFDVQSTSAVCFRSESRRTMRHTQTQSMVIYRLRL